MLSIGTAAGSGSGSGSAGDAKRSASAQSKPAGVLEGWSSCFAVNASLCHGHTGHQDGITHIDAKGDGVYFITNGKDQCTKLWDIRKMKGQRQCGQRGPSLNRLVSLQSTRRAWACRGRSVIGTTEWRNTKAHRQKRRWCQR